MTGSSLVFGIGGKADNCDRLIDDDPVEAGGREEEDSNCRCCVSWQRFLILAANSRWKSVSRFDGGGDFARINLIGSSWFAPPAVVATGWVGSSTDSDVGRNEDKFDRDRVSGEGRGNSDEPAGVKTTPSKMSEMNPTELLGPLLLVSAFESRSTSEHGPDCWCGVWNPNALVCLRLSGSSTSA
jgi:hypothetical protein